MSLTTILQMLGLDVIAVLFWVALGFTIMTIIAIFAHLPYKITLGLFTILAWFIFGFARLGSAIFKAIKIFDNPVAIAVVSCAVTLLIIFGIGKKLDKDQPKRKKK